MLSKFFSLFAITSIATLLSTGGLVGFLISQGHLNPDRANLIAEVLRGQHDELFAEEETEPDTPSETPLDGAITDGRSADAIRDTIAAKQLVDARLERAISNLVAQQRLVDSALNHLESESATFEQRVDDWQARRDKLTAADRAAGFKRELEYIEKLPPQMAKEHLIRTWKGSPDEAVRIVRALPVATGKKVLGEMTAPEELEIAHELLERLRLQEMEEFTQ